MQAATPALSPAPLNTYMTWCLGQDFSGFALIYAASSDEVFDLLDQYSKFAQPKHKMFPRSLNYRLLHYRPDCVSSRNISSGSYGEHVYLIGQASDEGRPRVIVLEDGEDVRFND